MESDTFRIVVEKLVQGGKGFARTPDGVVFIEGALPNEEVVCRYTDKKKDYGNAVAVEIIKPSEYRTDPICPYYGICGGCDLQHLAAEEQSKLKGQILQENLSRIGGISYTTKIPVFRGATIGYRNRARFQTVAKQGAAGFFGRRSGSIVPIESCPVLVPKLNELLQTPEKLINAANRASKDRSRQRRQSGVFAAANETVYAIEHQELSLQVNGKQFKTEPEVFFQSNREVFGKLVKNMISDLSGENAVDLYSGVGTIAAFLEDGFSRVTAVERNPLCLKYARKNLSSSVKFVTQSVESWVSGISKMEIDLLSVDPPRTGLSADAVSTIIKLQPKQILYISCDSVTFSRDMKLLAVKGGYSLSRLEAYDLYPHTSHLETSALLIRK
jgi:23S rRNA (uracil1939-C5)-methyltransferase